MTYRRFIILAQERTGSNFLASLLGSHRHVRVFGELFNPNDAIRKRSTAVEPLQDQQDPVDYLEKTVWSGYPPEVKAVGFRLFYNHAREDKWRAVWDYVKRGDVHVVHLRRRNLLDRYLSHQLAMNTDKWILFNDQERRPSEAITINPQACLTDFHERTWFIEEAENVFEESPRFEVFYEDLAADSRKEMRKIQQFLGLAVADLSAETKRQRKKEKTDLIANYDELRQEMTRYWEKGWVREEWLAFFDE